MGNLLAYTKFHSPRPVFHSPDQIFTRIGEGASGSFPACNYYCNRYYQRLIDRTAITLIVALFLLGTPE